MRPLAAACEYVVYATQDANQGCADPIQSATHTFDFAYCVCLRPVCALPDQLPAAWSGVAPPAALCRRARAAPVGGGAIIDEWIRSMVGITRYTTRTLHTCAVQGNQPRHKNVLLIVADISISVIDCIYIHRRCRTARTRSRWYRGTRRCGSCTRRAPACGSTWAGRSTCPARGSSRPKGTEPHRRPARA